MTVGSRLAFATWKLYRTSSLARSFLEPVVRRSAEKGLAAHEAFVLEAKPSERWARWSAKPWPGAKPLLLCPNEAPADGLRLGGLLRHWNVPVLLSPERGEGPREVWLQPVQFVRETPTKHTLEDLQRSAHPITRRVYGDPPIRGLRAEAGERPGAILLDARVLSPTFLCSPWGCVVSDAFDWGLGRTDWRDPSPPLVSARIDDVSGEHGLAWLRPFEDQGIRPSIGTLHDRWLAGPSVKELVAASRRGSSVSPHAFDMDRFIWFDAHRARPFSKERMAEHRAKIERDCEATGLVLGKTVNAHFDVIGETALEAARALGFRYVLGEHEVGQDWREEPRARDPLGTPLYCYGPVGQGASTLFAFQAEGAIASSAAKRSRYDWLRNFLEIDRRTNLPVKESLDRAGAVKQGVTQLLSALDAGFPAYLLAHELQLDALGAELVGELLSDVLREVKDRVPGVKLAAFDELPAACEARFSASRP